MDFLANSYRQAADLYQSMTPGSRWITGLLLIVIAVSVGYLANYTYQGGAGSYLFGGHEFSERDLQYMEAAFAKAGLKRWKRVGSRLRIPRGQEHAYVAALADGNALPRDFNSIFDEMMSKSNPFESPKSRELRARLLKQKYLSLVLSNLPGVEDATVQFDEITTGGFSRRKEKTAMVAVRGKGSKRLGMEMVESVRYTVASAVAGLAPEYVTVTDLVVGRAYPGMKQKGLDRDQGNQYAQQKERFESYWQDKITSALSMYPGIVVGVNVDLDPKVREATSKVTYDPRPTPIESSTTRKTVENTQIGGRPGTDPNLVVGNEPRSVSGGTGKRVTQDEQQEDQKSVAGHEQTVTEVASLVPKYVSASIGIPHSYLVRVWQKKNPPAEGEEPKIPTDAELAQTKTNVTKAIEEAVVVLLPPVPPGADGYTHVTVDVFDDFAPPPPEEDSVVAQAGSWLASNWQTLAMLGLSVFGLLMFRSMIRRNIPDPPATSATPAILSIANTGEDDEDEEDEGTTEGGLRRFRSDAPDLRGELTNMVKEDPDAAAAILRSWIGDAA